MIPSETVQAAQRLEISGTLVKMGGGVPSLAIEPDNGDVIVIANLPADLLAAMPMLLYKRVRLTVEAEGEPAPAAASEDAERAAYLERWKDAPEWADQLQQFPSQHCMWTGGGFCIAAGHNLLGSVRCEPRPTPAGGQGVDK